MKDGCEAWFLNDSIIETVEPLRPVDAREVRVVFTAEDGREIAGPWSPPGLRIPFGQFVPKGDYVFRLERR